MRSGWDGLIGRSRLVTEMSDAREDHREPLLVGRGDDFLVARGPPGLITAGAPARAATARPAREGKSAAGANAGANRISTKTPASASTTAASRVRLTPTMPP